MSDDFIITCSELVEVGICFTGQKTWFPEHGFDLRKVVKEGVSASALESTGDAIALRAVKLVRVRRGF